MPIGNPIASAGARHSSSTKSYHPPCARSILLAAGNLSNPYKRGLTCRSIMEISVQTEFHPFFELCLTDSCYTFQLCHRMKQWSHCTQHRHRSCLVRTLLLFLSINSEFIPSRKSNWSQSLKVRLNNCTRIRYFSPYSFIGLISCKYNFVHLNDYFCIINPFREITRGTCNMWNKAISLFARDLIKLQ